MERFIDHLDNYFEDRCCKPVINQDRREEKVHDEKHFTIPDHIMRRTQHINDTMSTERTNYNRRENNTNNLLNVRSGSNIRNMEKDNNENNDENNNNDVTTESFDDLFRVVDSSKKRTRSRDF